MQKSIYPPENYYASEPINIGQFISNNTFVNLLPDEPFIESNQTTIMKRNAEIYRLMDVNLRNAQYKELQKICSTKFISKIGTEKVSKPEKNPAKEIQKHYVPIAITDEARKFETISRLEKRLANDKTYNMRQRLKYKNTPLSSDKINLPKKITMDLIPGKEVLVHVTMYESVEKKTPTTSYNLVALGSNTINSLLERVICPNRLRSMKEMSDNPDEEKIFCQDKYTSGFVFIEDTFYNDMENPQNIDYSECILKWGASKDQIGEFQSKNIANVTFNDLTVRLGYPQVLVHFGDCEHVFMFTDIELLQPSDICSSVKYPYFSAFTRTKANYCNTCGRSIAKWVVTGSIRVPFDPSYFCEPCFYSYNYIDGKKIGEFNAYPYFNKNTAI